MAIRVFTSTCTFQLLLNRLYVQYNVITYGHKSPHIQEQAQYKRNPGKVLCKTQYQAKQYLVRLEPRAGITMTN